MAERENRDRIDVSGRTGLLHMVNMRHIIASGENTVVSAPYAWLDSALGIGNQRIKLEAEDYYAQALESIRQRSLASLEADPSVMALLKKASWDQKDREQWEKALAETVSQHHYDTPGLRDYRITKELPCRSTALERAVTINDLSSDIKDATESIEHDCETMSMTEGIIVQQLEDHLLPQPTKNNDESYKFAASYYYASGAVNWHANYPNFVLHAYLVSSATGNLIEATHTPRHAASPYHKTQADFSEVAEGVMALSTTGAVYKAGQSARFKTLLDNTLLFDEATALRQAANMSMRTPEQTYDAIIDWYHTKEEKIDWQQIPSNVKEPLYFAIAVYKKGNNTHQPLAELEKAFRDSLKRDGRIVVERWLSEEKNGPPSTACYENKDSLPSLEDLDIRLAPEDAALPTIRKPIESGQGIGKK
ncbi:MAG: hypothetical protein CMM93_05650 [Rickettsiales bacterium]|nr:hypothetical protein [Rickettsiales bacterium]